MVIVIAYDITDDRRRTQVAHLLQDHGQRVQRSVFECDLTKRHRTQLGARLTAVMDVREDNLRWYPLCRTCAAAVHAVNSPAVASSPAFYLI